MLQIAEYVSFKYVYCLSLFCSRVRNAQNGHLKRRFKVSKQKDAHLTSKRVRLSLQNLRAGHLLVAALQLLLLAPRVCQHGHLLFQLLSRLISHGLIDRNNRH